MLNKKWPKSPFIYEVNTWTWLYELSQKYQKTIHLGNIPTKEIEGLAQQFDAIWLMGMWERSPEGREVAVYHPGLQNEYVKTLSDFKTDDVVGSPYAIYEYQVAQPFGGVQQLKALRKQLIEVGLLLMLDFVPNHMAKDHPWITQYPDRFVQGTPDDMQNRPNDYFWAETNVGNKVFAHGKDPYFPGWTDTVQIDYRRNDTRNAMTNEVLKIAELCDGIRCDMAMLLLNDVFTRTWGGQFETTEPPFWSYCTKVVKEVYPDFIFMAEAYWDREYDLQVQGFDFTYDKRLYDRIGHESPKQVRLHLLADINFQSKLTRFLENHDEPRSIQYLGIEKQKAAAVLTFSLPGAKLIHEGQMQGNRIKLPVQLGRRPMETTNDHLLNFYQELFKVLQHSIFLSPQNNIRSWQLLDIPYQNEVIAHEWTLGENKIITLINLSENITNGLLPFFPGTNKHSVPKLEIILAANEKTKVYLNENGIAFFLEGFQYAIFRV